MTLEEIVHQRLIFAGRKGYTSIELVNAIAMPVDYLEVYEALDKLVEKGIAARTDEREQGMRVYKLTGNMEKTNG